MCYRYTDNRWPPLAASLQRLPFRRNDYFSAVKVISYLAMAISFGASVCAFVSVIILFIIITVALIHSRTPRTI